MSIYWTWVIVRSLFYRGDRYMTSIQKDAKKRHGDFVYHQTWLASTTEEKWRWALVGFWVITKFIFAAIFFSCMVLLSIHAAELLGTKYLHLKPLSELRTSVAVFTGILGWLYAELAFGSSFVAASSSFYSIAADMVRIKSKALHIRLFYMISGSLAVIFALMSWRLRKLRENKLVIAELDVLGSVLSKVAFWEDARAIYHDIGNLYAARFQGSNVLDVKDITVSYAFACKWMLDEPGGELKQSLRRTVIRETIKEFGDDLEPEVLARLYEALGEAEACALEREKIARKFAL